MKEIQDEVQNWDIENVRPYEKNAKLHTEEQVASIAKSIQTYGFDQPIVVDGEGVIIKGHGRRLAALHLGMSKVPVIVRTDLTANEANASRLADNRVAQGDVDTDLLQSELEEIASHDDGLLDSMGFSDKELEFMTSDLGEMDESALIDVLGSETGEAVSEALSDSESVKDARVSAKDVFGFTTLSGAQAKSIARWLSLIQGTYNTGDAAAAIATHAQEFVDATT